MCNKLCIILIFFLLFLCMFPFFICIFFITITWSMLPCTTNNCIKNKFILYFYSYIKYSTFFLTIVCVMLYWTSTMICYLINIFIKQIEQLFIISWENIRYTDILFKVNIEILLKNKKAFNILTCLFFYLYCASNFGWFVIMGGLQINIYSRGERITWTMFHDGAVQWSKEWNHGDLKLLPCRVKLQFSVLFRVMFTSALELLVRQL
jgi:hypothetical protein